MKNKSIGCNVNSCTHHAGSDNYCTLTQIMVSCEPGSHAHTKECTDCDSFKAKS
ncbi:MAG: DUF1540 domain-containing protein [Clostridium sp.]